MFAEWLQESEFTVVFTGAGMSTESGLPDFRSQQGLWCGKDPMLIASTYALENHRDEFVEFYQMRIKEISKHKPHIGHQILAEWEKRGLLHGVITQNVDGYHQQAGNEQVSELHGTLRTVHCTECGQKYDAKRYLEPHGTNCECGGFVRPSIVLFGEMLPDEALSKADEMIRQADLCVVLGSSLQVSPANFYPQMAKENGAKLVIVNMEPTELDGLADLVIHGERVGTWLKQVEEEING